MRHLLLPLGLAAIAATPAIAAERTYSVTDFDRIVVDGSFAVTVTTGPAISVRASGDQAAIDRIAATISARTLRITRDKGAWGGWPGGGEGRAQVAVTVPLLSAASLGGAGTLTIDRMTGGTLGLAVMGSGVLEVGQLEADRLTLSITGNGMLKVAGRAKQATANQRGSGALQADGLSVVDLALSTAGSGSATIEATRSATVTTAGSGVVRVTGDPACTVRSGGSGVVSCGD